MFIHLFKGLDVNCSVEQSTFLFPNQAQVF